MKIALLAARMPPACDGVGDHADRLARTLSERGHDIFAMTIAPVASTNDYRIELIGHDWGLATASRASKLLWSERPDALVVEYTTFLYGPRSPVPLAVLVASRSARIRSTVVVHEAFYAPGTDAVETSWKSSLLALRDRCTLMQANCIAVPSAIRAESLARRMPAVRQRIEVVPIGANIEPPSLYRRDPVRPARIVSFGVVAPRRRIDRAVDAVARLVADGRDVYLDIIGRVFDVDCAKAIEAQAEARGIAERVRFRGELEGGQLSTAFGETTVALHTAREGAIASSGSLLALLAHEVPVVALRTLHDDPSFDGALHYAQDDTSLVATLRAIVDEPAAADSLAAAGSARWRSHFGWNRVADTLLDTLREREARVRAIAS